ncbi:hypothetical protein KY289_036379 [Solanum tuberosum]|nr:hypothetical protein KY289_036379 [Solanum tuberosum]
MKIRTNSDVYGLPCYYFAGQIWEFVGVGITTGSCLAVVVRASCSFAGNDVFWLLRKGEREMGFGYVVVVDGVLAAVLEFGGWSNGGLRFWLEKGEGWWFG